MEIKKYFTKRKLLFVIIFAILGLFALQIPTTGVVGSEAKFTFFDAFAPITGAFIGSIPGVIAVFLMQFGNLLFHGAQIADAGTIIRFFPVLFAVLFFTRKRKINLIIPTLAISAFIAHPIGREVWFFSLFWTIPIFAYFFQEKSLIARALGATFTAHSVGGALWIWFLPLPAEIWISLIPLVIVERLLFALGISVSFLAVNNLLHILEKKQILNLGFQIEPKYLLFSPKR